MGCCEAQKLFWDQPMLKINFGFGSTSLTFCFKFRHILGLFCTFLGPFGLFFVPLGLFLEFGSGSKTFLEPTYVVNKLWFWKYIILTISIKCQQCILSGDCCRFGLGSIALSFCFYFGQIWGLFCPFWAIFGVEVRYKNIFGTYIHRLTTFILEV